MHKQVENENTDKPYTSEPIRTLRIGDCNVTILGTAHVSKNSVEAVKSFIETEKPDTVCVELCETRLGSIKEQNQWKKLDIFKVFKERKMYLLMSNLILSSFQKKIGGDVKPGDEFRMAIDKAKETNAKLVPIDREVQTTLKRSWGTVGLFSKMYLLSALIASLLVKEEVTPEKIEEMKSEDALKDLFSQLPKKYDEVKRVIIDERDIYLAENIRQTAAHSKNLFAAVGAGHLQGIMKYIEQENDLEPLREIPQPSVWQKLQFFVFPAIVVSLMTLVYLYGTKQDVKDVLFAWVVFKSSLAALGALVCMAHPVSIVLAALIAPIGNFNPILKPGWIAALSESYLRKPLVEDFEKIAEDSEKLSSLWSNRVIRIFLIFMLPQMGSSIGTFLAMSTFLSKLQGLWGKIFS
ncbi:MAG: TraB/GumN family protein [Spirochaetota bacterium]